MKKLLFGLIATVMFSFVGNSQDVAFNNDQINYSINEVDNLGINSQSNYLAVRTFDSTLPSITSTPLGLVSSLKGKPWWAIAAVDAGGAVGGALGCLQVTGGVAATNPAGWAATGICALVVGAGASVGYAVRGVNPTGTIDPIRTFPNPKNKLDYVGINHNKLVRDFINSKINYSGENFIKFVNENSSDYGIFEKILVTAKDLDEQDVIIQNLSSNDEEIINWVVGKLPTDVDSSKVSDLLNLLRQSSDNETALNAIVNYENEIIVDTKVSINSRVAMMGFLSTLRNSTVLWNK